MADNNVKLLNVRADVGQAIQKLGELEAELVKLRKRKAELNKQAKTSKGLTEAEKRELGQLSTQIKTTAIQTRQYSKSILVANGVMKKTSGFVMGIRKALTGMAAQFLGAMAAFALLKNVVGTFKDFEQANADLASVLGKTTDEIKDLTIEAKKYGATTKFTASEVSGLQKEFAKLGFSVKEIKNATKATLDLAAATNTDLARAAEVAGATVRGFGLDASETQRVPDVMAKSFSSSALDMEKFATSMRAVAPVAKNAGLNIEQTTSMLGILVDRGVDASTAGTSLRNVFLELSKKGLTFEEAMQQINESTDKNATSLDLFGKRGAVTGTILAETGVQVSELEEKLNNAGGAAERMAKTQLDTLSGKLTILNSAWEGFILGLEDGEGLLSGLLESMAELATSFLGVLTPSEKLSENLEDQRITMNTLALRITDANIAEGDRAKLIEELNTKYPEFNEHLLTEKSTNEEIAIAVAKVNEQLVNKIVIQRKQEEIDEVNTRRADVRIEQLEKEDRLTRLLAEASEEFNIKILENGTLSERATDAIQQLGEKSNGYGKLLNAPLNTSIKLNDALIGLNNANREGLSIDNELNSLLEKKNETLERLGITTENNLETTEEENETTEEGNLTLAERIALITQLQIDEAGLFTTRVKGIEEILAAEEALREFQGEGYNVFAGETEEEIVEDSDFLIAEYQKTLDGKKQLLDIALKNQEISEAEYRHKIKELNKEDIEDAKKIAKIKEQLQAQNVNDAVNLIGTIGSLMEQGTQKQKALMSAQALIQTYLAAQSAYASQMTVPDPSAPVRATIAAALAIAQGLARVAAINNVKFAKGGVLRGKSHARGGIPTIDGQYEFEGGEAVINKRSTARYGALLSQINQAGGGVAFEKGGITKFQDGGISAPVMSLSDIGDNGANDITQEVTSQVSPIKVVNVVTDTMEAQNSILNVQSEAEIG